MIVRDEERGFSLIRQHDHGLVSGEFARRFSEEWTGESPVREETFFAITNHDLGWKSLDSELLWNAENGRPYSFVDYPQEPKMEAYTRGINEVESRSSYAALLCSAHYGSFVAKSEEVFEARFRENEVERRERLDASLPDEKLRDFERDLRLLQLCDDLSLFVCLNEPGAEVHPWHRGGFDFLGRKFRPVWEEAASLRFESSPFARSFDIALPYRVIDERGSPVQNDQLRIRVRA